jgi:sugar phosphate isomerase/epimerase
VSVPRFGISTHLFHDDRLTRAHLALVAAHGFTDIELFATRSHFDYRDEAAIEHLAVWLRELGLTLHSVHAPIVEAMRNGQWVAPFSVASGDEGRRAVAVGEVEAALGLASRVPYAHLVVHLGLPGAAGAAAHDNQPAAARRSVEAMAARAAGVGVRLALEVIPNALSSPEALVRLIEEDTDGLDLGVCLDYGHAHLMGDLGEAIETLSGHLTTTHVHDNRGRRDDHLTPFSGTIDWDSAMMETQKIGYEGMLMFEIADDGDPARVLSRAATARARLEHAFITV